MAWILGSHMVEGEHRFPQAVHGAPHAHRGVHTSTGCPSHHWFDGWNACFILANLTCGVICPAPSKLIQKFFSGLFFWRFQDTASVGVSSVLLNKRSCLRPAVPSSSPSRRSFQSSGSPASWAETWVGQSGFPLLHAMVTFLSLQLSLVRGHRVSTATPTGRGENSQGLSLPFFTHTETAAVMGDVMCHLNPSPQRGPNHDS